MIQITLAFILYVSHCTNSHSLSCLLMQFLDQPQYVLHLWPQRGNGGVRLLPLTPRDDRWRPGLRPALCAADPEDDPEHHDTEREE